MITMMQSTRQIATDILAWNSLPEMDGNPVSFCIAATESLFLSLQRAPERQQAGQLTGPLTSTSAHYTGSPHLSRAP